MAGLTTPVVLGTLDIDLIGLYLDLDGTFPTIPPIRWSRRTWWTLSKPCWPIRRIWGWSSMVMPVRCFIIDELGQVVSPSVITALIARAELPLATLAAPSSSTPSPLDW